MFGGNLFESNYRTQCPGGGFCDCCDRRYSSGVRKLVELKDGLTIYHGQRDVDRKTSKSSSKLSDLPADTSVKDNVETRIAQSDDRIIFIVHNTRDKDVNVSEDLIPEIDLNTVSCPRCRYLMTRAKALLEGTSTVRKQIISCVCDSCTLQQRSRIPCQYCKSIVKQFLATSIRNDKENFLAFLANAARLATVDTTIHEFRKVPIGFKKIGDDLIERQRVSQKEKDETVENLKKVKKVFFRTPEKVLSIENVFVDEGKGIIGKSDKMHPTIRPLDTKAQTSSLQSTWRKKPLLFSGHVAHKSISDTILGIGTTGIKHLPSSELSLSLALKKDNLGEPMKLFFPHSIREEKKKPGQPASYEIIENTIKRLNIEADEKLRKLDSINKSNIAKKGLKLSKSDEKYTEIKESGSKENKENFISRKVKKDKSVSKKRDEGSQEKVEKGGKIKKQKNIQKMDDKMIKVVSEKKKDSIKTREQIKKGKDKLTETYKFGKIVHGKEKLGQRKNEESFKVKTVKIEDKIIDKLQGGKDKKTPKPEVPFKDGKTLKVDEGGSDKIEKESIYKDTGKTPKQDKKSSSARGPKHSKEEATKYGDISKVPKVGDLNDQMNLLNKVLKKHDEVKTESAKYRKRQHKDLKDIVKMADKKAQSLRKAKSLDYIDVKGKIQVHKTTSVEIVQGSEPKHEIEVQMKDIKTKISQDDLILRLIKKYKRNIPSQKTVDLTISGRKIVKTRRRALSSYTSSGDDESENTDQLQKIRSDLIFGNTIINKRDLPSPPPQIQPIVYQSVLQDKDDNARSIEQATNTEASDVKQNGEGVFKYALSDRTFIENGWTVLPVEKILRKMNVYRMTPAQPEFDWFKRNRGKGPIFYNSGEKLAEVTNDGRGRWYYKNGRIALDYYDAEDANAQQRFVIYSSGDVDDRGRYYPITVLGMFDYKGNGVVFDHSGKIRLKYNQTEGVVLDRGIGPVSHWTWHSLNEPPELQQVMIDTRLPFIDPHIYNLKTDGDDHIQPRQINEDVAAIEIDNYLKEKNLRHTKKFKPYQINMKAMRINEQFSLKVLDQKTVYLIFREGTNTIRLNLGMVLDDTEIIDTTSSDVGEVKLDIEKQPAETASVAGLQKRLLNAQRSHQVRTERELKKRPIPPGLSVDKLTSAVSKPTPAPLLTTNVLSNYSKCGIPIPNDLYINTRLI